jgi:tripartite-type tricarboxylate transporter receptor subunit TctC
MRSLFNGWLRLGLSVVTLATTVSGHGQSLDEPFRGKTIRLVIGFEPGTAYDLYARLVARHLGRYLPGQPQIVPQTMPGAGSLNAYNYTFNVAPRDGTVLAIGHRFVPFMPLLDVPGAQFDPARFTYIGSANKEVDVCIARGDAGLTSPKDLKEREIIVGTTGAGAELTTFYGTIRSTLQARLKVVTGYRSQNDLFLAMERGEIQGRCGGSYSSVLMEHPDWLTSGFARIWMQIGLQKDRQLPNVPLLSEVIDNEIDRQAVALMLSANTMGRPFFAPPEIPPERAEALRAAFSQAMRDPDLQAEAKKQMLDIDPIGGEEMLGIVRHAYQSPKDVVQRARALVNGR